MDDNRQSATRPPSKSAQRAVRYKVFEPAELSIGADRTRAHMLNVSESGALVHAAEIKAKKGNSVGLKIGGDWFPARIMWIALPRLGLAFDGRLPADVLARLLGD